MDDTAQTHTRLAALPSAEDVDEGGDDRRVRRRVGMKLPVRMCTELLQLEGQIEERGCVENASERGFFVRSDFLEPPGTRVLMQVLLPSGPMTARGTVAWVAEVGPDGPGMGIALDEPLRSRWLSNRLRSA